MGTTIFELITHYGLNTVIIAIVIFFLTGFLKMPIKSLAKNRKDGKNLTRYITFLPIILGFGITTLYLYIFQKRIIINGDFMTLWLTSSSLSLAIYAFKEKFIPSKSAILSAYERKQNEELIDEIRKTVLPKMNIKPIKDLQKQEDGDKVNNSDLIKLNMYDKETKFNKTNEKNENEKTVEQKPLQKIILRGASNAGTDKK